MYRTLTFVLLLILLGACTRKPEPVPSLPKDPTQPLFTDVDLRKARLVKETKREQLQGKEIDLELPEIERPYEGTETEGDLSPQTVIAGVDGWVVYIRSNGTTYQIYRHDQITDVRLQVFSDTDLIDSVSISLDGDHIFASIFNSATNSQDIYELIISSGTTNQLTSATTDETNVSVSADGSVVVWEGDNAGLRVPFVCVYIANSCTNTILSSVNNQVQPSVSGNGAYVALIEELPIGSDKIKLYNRSTSIYTTIATTAEPALHPSSNDAGTVASYLLDHSSGTDYIKVKDLVTGVTSNERTSTTPIDHPQITADGLYLAYAIESSTTGKLIAKTRDIATNLEGATSNVSYDHFGTFWQKIDNSLTRVYVDKDAVGANTGRSWVNAFTKLQDALNCIQYGSCQAASEIWVASGTYYPDEGVFQTNNNESTSFNLLDNLAIYGGFDGVGAGGVGGTHETLLSQRLISTNLTILSGDIVQDDTNVDGNNIAEFTSHILGDNSDHVLYADSVEFATLDGFTVTAGQADGVVNTDLSDGGGFYTPGSSNLTFATITFYGNSADSGGAMYNSNLDNATFTGVQFIENSSDGRGGAIYNIDSDNHTYTDFSIFLNNAAAGTGGAIDNVGSSDHTYNNVDFLSNSAVSAGGALQNVASSNNHTYTNVDFIGNSAGNTGGAIRMSSSIDHSYSNVLFSVNSATNDGGAISNEFSSSINLDRAIFVANSAGASDNGGGIYNKDSSVTATNSMFSGNTAGRGAVLYNYKSSSTASATATVRQVSFSRNAASISGGAIGLLGGANTVIQNSIFWGNTAPAGFGYNIYNNASFISTSRSDVQGAWNGVGVVLVNGGSSSNPGGNINANPRFIDANGADNINGTTDDNLRLGVNSPCLDTGSNAVASGSVDLDGNPRIVDGPDVDANATIDMGAYERQ